MKKYTLLAVWGNLPKLWRSDHVLDVCISKKFPSFKLEDLTSTMLSTTWSKGLERALTSTPSATIPSFLLPAFPLASTRCFSSSPNRASQIGRAPLSIPPEVKFEILPPVAKKGAWGAGAARSSVKVDGPLGMWKALEFV
jgi:hypothetical protein